MPATFKYGGINESYLRQLVIDAISLGNSLDQPLLIPGGGNSNGGNSLLHLCVIYDLQDCVAKLLSAGADPNCKNIDGLTPSDLALEAGNQVILQALNRRQEYRKLVCLYSKDSELEIEKSDRAYFEEGDKFNLNATTGKFLTGKNYEFSEFGSSSESNQAQSIANALSSLSAEKILPLRIGAVYEDYMDWTDSVKASRLKELIDTLKTEERIYNQDLKDLSTRKQLSLQNLSKLHDILRNKEHSICLQIWDNIRLEKKSRRTMNIINEDVQKLKTFATIAEETVYFAGDVQTKDCANFLFERWKDARLFVTSTLLIVDTTQYDDDCTINSPQRSLSFYGSSPAAPAFLANKVNMNSTDGVPPKTPYLSWNTGPIRRALRRSLTRINNCSGKVVSIDIESLIELEIVKFAGRGGLEQEIVLRYSSNASQSNDGSVKLPKGNASSSSDTTTEVSPSSIHLKLINCIEEPDRGKRRQSMSGGDNLAYVLKSLHNKLQVRCSVDGRSLPYQGILKLDRATAKQSLQVNSKKEEKSSERRRRASFDGQLDTTSNSKISSPHKQTLPIAAAPSAVYDSSMAQSSQSSSLSSAFAHGSLSICTSSGTTSAESIATITSAMQQKRAQRTLSGIIEEESFCSPVAQTPQSQQLKIKPRSHSTSNFFFSLRYSPSSEGGGVQQMSETQALFKASRLLSPIPSNLSLNLALSDPGKSSSGMPTRLSETSAGLCMDGAMSLADEFSLSYRSPLLDVELISTVEYIVELKKVLEKTKSYRDGILEKLEEYVVLREKLLEGLYYLHSLRAIVDDPPSVPTRQLTGTVHSSLLERVTTLLMLYQEHVDQVTQEEAGLGPRDRDSMISGSFDSNALSPVKTPKSGRRFGGGDVDEINPLSSPDLSHKKDLQILLRASLMAEGDVSASASFPLATPLRYDLLQKHANLPLSTPNPNRTKPLTSFRISPWKNFSGLSSSSGSSKREPQLVAASASGTSANRGSVHVDRSLDGNKLNGNCSAAANLFLSIEDETDSPLATTNEDCSTRTRQSISEGREGLSGDSTPSVGPRAYRNKLGPPPPQFRKYYEKIMNNIEEVWNCELESFEAAEKLAQSFALREHTWARLTALKYEQEQQRQVVPRSTELYDVEI